MRIPTIAVLLALFGCSAVDEPNAPSADGASLLLRDTNPLTISPSPAYAEVRETQQFRIQVTDPRRNPATGPVIWASSDPSVATIDRSGLATARKKGVTRISATVQNYVATAVLQVFDLSRIAWTRDENLFVMTGLGASATALTTGKALGAEWSPDGTKLVYYGCGGLCVMNPDGSGQTKITSDGQDQHPVWSPTGTKIAFIRVSGSITNMNIMTVAPNGTGLKQLTATPTTKWDITWSPDGTRLAFSDGGSAGVPDDIYVVNADGSGLTNLSADAALDEGDPAWSPDGSKLAFAKATSLNGLSDIYVMNPDGTGKTNLTGAIDAPATQPRWSPDGGKILFKGSGDLHVMNANGTNVIQLTAPNTVESNASWSPDGDRIAFEETPHDDPNSEADIGVVTADGSKRWNLTNSPQVFDDHPRWRP